MAILPSPPSNLSLSEPGLLSTRPGLAVPYLLLMGTSSVAGVAGNTLIVAAFCVSGRVRVLGNEYVLSLALVDLIVSLLATPMLLVGAVSGRAFFTPRAGLCQAVACVCLAACICAFLTLTAVTVHRYTYICHPRLHPALFTRRSVCATVAAIWLLAFTLEASNFLGWSGHRFDDKHLACMWDRVSHPSYTLFLACCLIGAPITLMVFAYARIFHVVYLDRRRVRSEVAGPDLARARQALDWLDVVRSTKTFFFVLLAFIFMWGPYAVVVAVDLRDRLALELHLAVSALAHMHTALNALIYLRTNQHFRAAFKKVLHLQARGQRSEVSIIAHVDNALPVRASDICPSVPLGDGY